MKKDAPISEKLNIDKSWSLFLDRDGVVNKRLPDDYVKTVDEFQFLSGAPEAMKIFSEKFSYIFIVTNQQGIGKGLMSTAQLQKIHDHMKSEVEKSGGKIDQIFYAPHLKSEHHPMRKPGVGMALKAKKEFPNVDFRRSIIAGDSISDMIFGKRLKMKTIFISDDSQKCREHDRLIDYRFVSLEEFAKQL